MAHPKKARWAALAVPFAAVALAVTGLGSAQASSHRDAMNMGQDGFGKTAGSYESHALDFTYSKGYFCDTTVPAASTTGCEVGAKWVKAPSKKHDPLYITVPLGFTQPMMSMQCPDKLVCIDHPATLDLSRLATTLAPIFGTTPELLAPALKNFATPGHDHFIDDTNKGKAEWWDVYVIGVTDRSTFDKIAHHDSLSYIQSLIDAKNPNVTAPIPTNLFLYFSAK